MGSLLWGMLAPLALEALEIETLAACALRGPHQRMRRRAQAVLAHHRGLCINQLAAAFGAHVLAQVGTEYTVTFDWLLSMVVRNDGEKVIWKKSQVINLYDNYTYFS